MTPSPMKVKKIDVSELQLPNASAKIAASRERIERRKEMQEEKAKEHRQVLKNSLGIPSPQLLGRSVSPMNDKLQPPTNVQQFHVASPLVTSPRGESLAVPVVSRILHQGSAR